MNSATKFLFKKIAWVTPAINNVTTLLFKKVGCGMHLVTIATNSVTNFPRKIPPRMGPKHLVNYCLRSGEYNLERQDAGLMDCAWVFVPNGKKGPTRRRLMDRIFEDMTSLKQIRKGHKGHKWHSMAQQTLFHKGLKRHKGHKWHSMAQGKKHRLHAEVYDWKAMRQIYLS